MSEKYLANSAMKYLKIDTLDKGWHDRDEILLHASFQVLVDFVEKEEPDKIVDWNADELHRDAWKEIKSLYAWWKKVRLARRNPLDDKSITIPPFETRHIPGSKYCEFIPPDRKKYAAYYRAMKKLNRLEKNWLEEDQRNLYRLIEIRKFLWT